MNRRRKARSAPCPRVHEAVGATHIHTTYSDGTGTPAEVAEHARRRGLDWIIITDHETLKAQHRSEEGFYGPVCVLVGAELGDEDEPNHYLAYGIGEIPASRNPNEYVRAVHRMGGFGAAAHPHEKREAFSDLPPYPWTAWDAPLDGIEIWNQLSQWTEGLRPGNRLKRFIHPLKSLTRPAAETLAVWDELNRVRPVVGYVGVDAHALRYPLLGGLLHVKVFHYRVQFRSLLVHLQLPDPLPRGDFEKAEAAILRALRHGRHYGANHRAGDPSGFLFYAVEGERCLLPIETAAPGPEREFIARTPLEAEIVLRRDGREVVRVQGRELRHRSSGEGVWRVEAYRKRRGWIFSNPIRILPQQKSSSAR